MNLANYDPVIALDPQQISTWREYGRQPFAAEGALQSAALKVSIDVTPRLFSISADMLPTAVSDMATFLKERLPRTKSSLDETAEGKPEGIVLRTEDRSVIAKARFDDYERTLKRRGNRK